MLSGQKYRYSVLVFPQPHSLVSNFCVIPPQDISKKMYYACKVRQETNNETRNNLFLSHLLANNSNA